MRLGLIIYGSLNALTGGYIYDKILVQYLKDKGHTVDVISLPRRNYGRHLLDNLLPKLRFDLAAAPYDLLLQDELNHPSLFLVNKKLKENAAYPIVAIVHQVLCRQPRNSPLNIIYQEIEKRYLRTVDACIYNSRTTRKSAEDLIDDVRPSIVACPGGDRLGQLSSIDRIQSRVRDSGPLRLIFVGNLLPNKGLLPLVNALSGLSPEKWFLTVIGDLSMDSNYTRRVERLIVNKRLSRQVELAGSKNEGQLAHYLSRGHLFVMPYSHEGFGMAHMEAMAFGLPVIGSASGAVKEFVITAKNGFLIGPNDFRSVKKHLNDLYHDRQALAKMSHAALQTFEDRPKWKDTLDSIHGYLFDLVTSKKEFDG